MFTYHFPMCSATATLAPIDPATQEIMLVRRSPKAKVHPNKWSLLGGFLNTKIMLPDGDIVRPGETLRQAMVREAMEEANLLLNPADLELFEEYSDPGLDPRAHVVNCCYFVTRDAVSVGAAPFIRGALRAGDDVSELKWVTFEYMLAPTDLDMAFNHQQIAVKAIRAQQWSARAHQLIKLHGLQDAA